MTPHRTLSLVSFTALAIMAGTFAAGTASAGTAGSRDGDPVERVRYDDLDLSTEAGVRALYQRVRAAAAHVCGPALVTGTRMVSERYKDCVNESVREAVLRINRPTLTAYYAAQLRRPATWSTG